MNFFSSSAAARKDDHLYLTNKGNLRKDHELLARISASLEAGKCVVLFYYDIARFQEIEQGCGLKIAQYIIRLFNSTLAHGLKELYKKDIRILATEGLWGDDFIVIAETAKAPTLTTLESLSTAYRRQIKESMNREFLRLTGRDMDVNIGYAIIADKTRNAEVQLYNATKRAFGIAKGLINMHSVKHLPEFKEILAQKKLSSVYQPIMSIRSAAVLGWEALVRGPESSYFQMPNALFPFAEEEGLLYPLEKICRESALTNLGELGPGQKIFVNVHPNTINDPAFTGGETLRIIQKLGIKPENVVFEITERHQIKDFISFNKTLTYYRDQGFLVAVDDVGCGFSSLQSIAEIRPDYIKIDMALVRGIHKDRVKTALMETFVTFAEKIGCEIIAEGIEEEAELATLASIGVHYGQGYFLGRPAYPKQNIREEAYLKTVHFVGKGWQYLIKRALPIGDIVDEAVCRDQQTPVKEVKAVFEESTLLSGIVIVENDRPCGLVMRQHLDRHLGRKYGVALYYEKPIAKIMDKLPLMVDFDTPIEVASQAAMNRSKLKLYDNIIVTRNGLLQGIVSVQTLLDTMTRIRLELAKGANPLTGLPGNIAIEQEHQSCVRDGGGGSIIFIDLDNFKSYNDKYGFEKGDTVILYAAELLKEGLRKHGGGDDFLGHIGGDDFIIFTKEESVDSMCRYLIDNFDAGIKDLYSPEDREAGGIMAHGRSGEVRWFPFISISMAVLDCTADTGKDMKEISGNAAQLKQYAKSMPGSVYVRNRRKE